ncbi:MAG TPA: ABC transporter substrate-binding protein [Candidatus Binatia bacterium]|jgi:NitT/TauT family transport system substrate-binding protein
MMRKFALIFAVALLLFPGRLAAQPKMKAAYASISANFAGLWMAKEIGAFEKYGLAGELVYIASGSVTVQAMMGGDIQMAVGASNAVVSAILRGAPLVAIGSVANRPAMVLWVQPEITRPEQLQGKVLGISRFGSTTHFLMNMVLEKYGLKDKVKIQPLGGVPEMEAAFGTGMIAGAILSIRPASKARMLVDLPELGIPYSMDLMAVKRDYLKSSPKAVEAILKAYIEGMYVLKTKKDEAQRVLAKYMRRSPDSVTEPYEYAVKYLDTVPAVEPATIHTVLNWEGKGDMAVDGFFDNAPVDRLVKDGFVERLAKERGK